MQHLSQQLPEYVRVEAQERELIWCALRAKPQAQNFSMASFGSHCAGDWESNSMSKVRVARSDASADLANRVEPSLTPWVTT